MRAVVLACWWWIVACGGSTVAPVTNAPGGAEADRVDPRIAQIERALLPAVQVVGEPHTARLLDRMRELNIPGLSIAVFEHHELVWARGYGVTEAGGNEPVTDTTLFQAASISKPVTALAALTAVADGTLALDAPINDALTRWKLPENELTRATPVTLRRLLSHTAGTTVHGFAGYAPGAPVPTIAQVLDGAPPANSAAVRVDLAPGSRFRYSGGGTSIVQLALVERLGQPYPEIVARRVLAPLGMAHSTYEQPLPPERAKHAASGHHRDGSIVPGKHHVYPEMAAAGLWTTPSDLAVFLAEIGRARAGSSKRISREIATQMTTKVMDIEGGEAISTGMFLWERNGTKVFGHSGVNEGFRSTAMASLDGGFGLVIMASSDSGQRLFPEIVRTVWDAFGWPGADAPITRIALDPAQRAKLTGRFVANMPFAIELAGDRLELRRPFAPAVELVPVAANVLIARDFGTELRFDPSTGGLELRNGPGASRQVRRLADAERSPLLELAAGREAEAIAAWNELSKRDPKNPALDEAQLNELGYDRLFERDTASAIAILGFVAKVRPGSANAHDSLGEAYAAAGDTARAIASYETAIARLAADSSLPPDAKERLRKGAEAQLARLRAAAK